MPKSIEHYQQETGRAGRDGLEAECVLLYTAADAIRWEGLLTKSAQEADQPAEVLAAQLRLIKQIQQLANSPVCRHRTLSEHFGQAYEKPSCGACDVCLGEVEGLEDATVTAQKILSCVARTGERFGVGHIVEVLQGANTDKVRKFGHERLSVYGLLKEMPKKELQSMVYQLVDQGLREPLGRRNAGFEAQRRFLDRDAGPARGATRSAKGTAAAKTATTEENWEGVDRGLFDDLREWRRGIATERKHSAVHCDARHNAQGSGPRAADDAGSAPPHRGHRREAISRFWRGAGRPDRRLLRDARTHDESRFGRRAAPIVALRSRSRTAPPRGRVSDVPTETNGRRGATAAGRAVSTVWQYLEQFVAERRPASIDAWVAPATYRRVCEAAADAETPRLKPLHEKLGGEVPYEEIRFVLAHLKARAESISLRRSKPPRQLRKGAPR